MGPQGGVVSRPSRGQSLVSGLQTGLLSFLALKEKQEQEAREKAAEAERQRIARIEEAREGLTMAKAMGVSKKGLSEKYTEYRLAMGEDPMKVQRDAQLFEQMDDEHRDLIIQAIQKPSSQFSTEQMTKIADYFGTDSPVFQQIAEIQQERVPFRTEEEVLDALEREGVDPSGMAESDLEMLARIRDPVAFQAAIDPFATPTRIRALGRSILGRPLTGDEQQAMLGLPQNQRLAFLDDLREKGNLPSVFGGRDPKELAFEYQVAIRTPGATVTTAMVAAASLQMAKEGPDIAENLTNQVELAKAWVDDPEKYGTNEAQAKINLAAAQRDLAQFNQQKRTLQSYQDREPLMLAIYHVEEEMDAKPREPADFIEDVVKEIVYDPYFGNVVTFDQAVQLASQVYDRGVELGRVRKATDEEKTAAMNKVAGVQPAMEEVKKKYSKTIAIGPYAEMGNSGAMRAVTGALTEAGKTALLGPQAGFPFLGRRMSKAMGAAEEAPEKRPAGPPTFADFLRTGGRVGGVGYGAPGSAGLGPLISPAQVDRLTGR